MSTQRPRLEARVSAQERMQLMLHARLEELSEDMVASFKQQMAEQAQFEQKVDVRFDQVDSRLDKIETTMATKEDVATLEKRVLDAFQQLLTVIDQRLPPLEK